MEGRDRQDRHSHPGTRACRAAIPNCRRNTNDSLTKGIVRDSSTPLGMTIGCSVTLLAEVEAVHSVNFIASCSDRLATLLSYGRPLQTLERFFGERFRFLDLRLFVIRSAEADGDESVPF